MQNTAEKAHCVSCGSMSKKPLMVKSIKPCTFATDRGVFPLIILFANTAKVWSVKGTGGTGIEIEIHVHTASKTVNSAV